ncbi:hypothetical protein PG993_002015 [Apiospora rasikravindrae]|uniref:Uncharacterized protein n=1 Tax=Apiospora rasikravindrae TaxID=990691 RepID=A0ABR1UD25_9PEZI
MCKRVYYICGHHPYVKECAAKYEEASCCFGGGGCGGIDQNVTTHAYCPDCKAKQAATRAARQNGWYGHGHSSSRGANRMVNNSSSDSINEANLMRGRRGDAGDGDIRHPPPPSAAGPAGILPARPPHPRRSPAPARRPKHAVYPRGRAPATDPEGLRSGPAHERDSGVSNTGVIPPQQPAKAAASAAAAAAATAATDGVNPAKRTAVSQPAHAATPDDGREDATAGAASRPSDDPQACDPTKDAATPPEADPKGQQRCVRMR